MDLCVFPESENEKDSAIDFSLRKVSLEESSQEPGVAPSRANPSDPMKLWYTVDTDPR